MSFQSYDDYLLSFSCWLDYIKRNPGYFKNNDIDQKYFIGSHIYIGKFSNVIGIQLKNDSPSYLYFLVLLNEISSNNNAYLLRKVTINDDAYEDFTSSKNVNFTDQIIKKEKSKHKSHISNYQKLKVTIAPRNYQPSMDLNEIVKSTEVYLSWNPNFWEVYWYDNYPHPEYDNIDKLTQQTINLFKN